MAWWYREVGRRGEQQCSCRCARLGSSRASIDGWGEHQRHSHVVTLLNHRRISFPASQTFFCACTCALMVHGHVQMRSCVGELYAWMHVYVICLRICIIKANSHIRPTGSPSILHTMRDQHKDSMTRAANTGLAIKQNTASAESSARARPKHADQGTSTTRRSNIVVSSIN